MQSVSSSSSCFQFFYNISSQIPQRRVHSNNCVRLYQWVVSSRKYRVVECMAVTTKVSPNLLLLVTTVWPATWNLFMSGVVQLTLNTRFDVLSEQNWLKLRASGSSSSKNYEVLNWKGYLISEGSYAIQLTTLWVLDWKLWQPKVYWLKNVYQSSFIDEARPAWY